MKIVAMVKVVEDYTVNAYFVTLGGETHRVSMFDDLIEFLSGLVSFNGIEYVGSRVAFSFQDSIAYKINLERHEY